MNASVLRIVCTAGILAAGCLAQEVIPLYSGAAPGSTVESYPEKRYFSTTWKTDVVSNVTRPTLTLYKPTAGSGNGNAVVICPGGGFMALSINSEGIDVAKWLSARGFTAFVLKYRLARTGEDATQEFTALFQDRAKFDQVIGKTIPLSIADGQAAVVYVRKHASEWGITPDHVGIMGFSAGGTVTAGVGVRYTPEGRPSFVAPIYAADSVLKNEPVPADAPPMFLAAATDDQLGLTMDSVDLYDRWIAAHKTVELHMYAKGGHGFGMRKQNLPSDHWIERFEEWFEVESGLISKGQVNGSAGSH